MTPRASLARGHAARQGTGSRAWGLSGPPPGDRLSTEAPPLQTGPSTEPSVIGDIDESAVRTEMGWEWFFIDEREGNAEMLTGPLQLGGGTCTVPAQALKVIDGLRQAIRARTIVLGDEVLFTQRVVSRDEVVGHGTPPMLGWLTLWESPSSGTAPRTRQGGIDRLSRACPLTATLSVHSGRVFPTTDTHSHPPSGAVRFLGR
jgi:hypothetical protein